MTARAADIEQFLFILVSEAHGAENLREEQAYHASLSTSLLRLEENGLFVVAYGASLVRAREL